jgi:inosine-uridine nucleoside N-ribohydrolase
MLELARRTDVPIGIGLKLSDSEGAQAPWVADYNLAKYPGKVHQDGVQALIDTIMQSAEPVTLLCIGPVPNVKAALEREPRIARRARFVGMHGSVRRGYDGKAKPDPEYNVKENAAACRAAFTASWDITITPLDTCGLVRLQGGEYSAVRDSSDPLARAVIENYRIWSRKYPDRAKSGSSILFDTVAVYLAISEGLLVMEDLGIRVTDDGFTVIDPKAKVLHCATEWKNLPAFRQFLVRRLTGG